MDGDAEALGELYRHFQGRVLGLCRHLLGGHEDAEDATSEVFSRLPKALKSYQPNLPFPRWLLSVASHHCVDRSRRRQLEQRLFEAEPADTLNLPVQGLSPLEQDLRRRAGSRSQGDCRAARTVSGSSDFALLQRHELRRDRRSLEPGPRQRGHPDFPGQATVATDARRARSESS